jgi:hypothetical protein
VSTVLTLFVVPVLHDTFNDLEIRLKARRSGTGPRGLAESEPSSG